MAASAATTSGHNEPPLGLESIKSIITNFCVNLENSFKDQVKDNNNSENYDGNQKTSNRHSSLDEHKGTKRKCNDVKDNSESHIERDHYRILSDKDQQSNLENKKNTIDKNCRSTEKSHNNNAKASKISSEDIQLKYSCYYCIERFPTLTTIKRHVQTKHKVANSHKWRMPPSRRKKNHKYQTIEKNAKSAENASKATRKDDNKVEPKAKEKPQPSKESKSMLLYICNVCKLASISYDCMIEHCQDHIIENEESSYCLNRREIERYIKILGQKYNVDVSTYNVEADIRDPNVVRQINCDYELLKTDNWPGILDTFTKPEIDRINGASIYNFTRIIRLSSNDGSLTSSAPFMLYQCVRCRTHVDPHSIVSHVQQNLCHEKHNSFPCYDCGRPFFSESAMYLHYKTHKVVDADKKYKTILFNDDKDFYVNSLLLQATGIQINYEQSGKYSLPQKSSISHVENKNARAMIIQGTQSRGKSKPNDSINITNNAIKERVADIYKCQCGLCFHNLESLFKHLENGHDETKLRKCTCTCGLDFDETQYSLHCRHSESFTSLNVRRVIISEEQTIDVRNMQHKINENGSKHDKDSYVGEESGIPINKNSGETTV